MSAEVTLLSRLHGVPVVSVVLPGDRSDPAHLLAYRVSDALVATWPQEAREVATGLPDDVAQRIDHVGGLSRWEVSARRGPTRSPGRVTVLAGAGGTLTRPAQVAAAKREARDWRWTVLASPPLGTWLRDPDPVLRGSDVIVTHAGQNAVAEVAAVRRPAIVIPEPRPHGEQQATARALADGPWPVTVLPAWPSVGLAPPAGRGVAARRVHLALVVRRRGSAPVRPCPRADRESGRGRTRSRMTVAVVTLAHGRHEHLRLQSRSLSLGTRLPDRYIVVAMDDPAVSSLFPESPVDPLVVEVASDRPGLPLARARNVGVRRALDEGADVVVLLDVDCLAGPELVAGYVACVEQEPQTVWSGPTTYLPPRPQAGTTYTGCPSSTTLTPHVPRRRRVSWSMTRTPTSSGRCPSP